MSNRELAKSLLDQISDAKLLYVIPYLQGASLSDETPNMLELNSSTKFRRDYMLCLKRGYNMLLL